MPPALTVASADDLRARWAADLPDAPAEASAAAFADLVARHGEAHRRYHTIGHVAAVLDALDLLGAGREARLAAWYHDAVYDPTATDNEARSARLAAAVLPGLGVDDRTVTEVARLVELTKTHDVTELHDTAGAALVDADLSILGADERTYDTYAAGVRAEYAHVPDDLWRAGRPAVLRTFAERPALFHTAAARARWEAPARANLARELAALA
jgi:predicted metal-dependent HD superfamily phosphohydrolase